MDSCLFFPHEGEQLRNVSYHLVEKTVGYTDPKTGQEKRRSTVTKNEVYRQLLRQAVHSRIPFRYVLNAVWYAAADNMKFVKHELGREFIMPLKDNRQVTLRTKNRGVMGALMHRTSNRIPW